MIVSVDLPKSLAEAVSLEAGRMGMTPSSWIVARMSDAFGLRGPARASVVPVITTPISEARR